MHHHESLCGFVHAVFWNVLPTPRPLSLHLLTPTSSQLRYHLSWELAVPWKACAPAVHLTSPYSISMTPQFIVIAYLASAFPTRIQSLRLGAFSGCSPLHFQCSARLLAISKPSINIWWNEYKNKSLYPLDWNSTWQILRLCTKHESALKEYVRKGNL